MSKYDPLLKTLEKTNAPSIPLTFEEIEEILGFNLPNSARVFRPWWSNDAKSHSQARAWLMAGYKASEVNLEGETVTFVQDTAAAGSDRRKGQIFGALKGTVVIEDGYDLTAPADPDWGRTYD